MADVKREVRVYSSAVREESARRTRQAVVDAATVLFVERGYAATSLKDIADAAGVARPTVFAAFGAKHAVLARVVDQALAGDDEPVPVAERPWFRPVWDAAEPAAVLAAYAGVCTVIAERADRVFEAVRRAADESTELADLWANLQHNRRLGAAMVVRRVRELGPLRAGLTVAHATDALWILNDPAHHVLVSERGWSRSAYVAWLARQMRAAVLPDR